MASDKNLAVAVGSRALLLIFLTAIPCVFMSPDTFSRVFMGIMGAIAFFGFVLMRSANSNTAEDEEDELDEESEALKKLSEGLAAKTLKPGEELNTLMQKAGLNFGEISNTSDVIGLYKDNNVHDWVEIKNTSTGEVNRYEYFGMPTYDCGNPVIPVREGKLFALFNEILYVRNV